MAWLDWFDVCGASHERTFAHGGRLSSLPRESDRELAALWRVETDIFSGAYLQFLANWGRESYVFASQALKRIGAHKKANIIDRCQALVDEHFECEGKSAAELGCLFPNALLGSDGTLVKKPGSVLPEPVVRSTSIRARKGREHTRRSAGHLLACRNSRSAFARRSAPPWAPAQVPATGRASRLGIGNVRHRLTADTRD